MGACVLNCTAMAKPIKHVRGGVLHKRPTQVSKHPVQLASVEDCQERFHSARAVHFGEARCIFVGSRPLLRVKA